MEFKLGDSVKWTSQAGGVSKTKVGTVVAIIPADKYPVGEIEKFSDCISRYGGGLSRNHTSYLVKVELGGRKKPRIYWPRVKALEEAPCEN